MVYTKLPKPNKILIAKPYQQQLIDLDYEIDEKRLIPADTQSKVNFLHNSLPHVAKLALKWLNLMHATYSRDYTPSKHKININAVQDQYFRNHEDIQKWLKEWMTSKDKHVFFFVDGSHKLPERRLKILVNRGLPFLRNKFVFLERNPKNYVIHQLETGKAVKIFVS